MSWSVLPVSHPLEAASATFNSMDLLLWEFHPEALLGSAWKEGRLADSINLPSTGDFPRLVAQLGRAGVPIAMDEVLNIWDFCGCLAGVYPERVKGSRPLQPGEVELVTALRRSAGQVIKMTNEQKSIMKLVFSGNAGHKRKNTSAGVAGAGMSCPVPCTAPFSTPSCLSLPGTIHSGQPGWLCTPAPPWGFWFLLEQSLWDSRSLWVLLQREAAPGYRKSGIPKGARGEVEFLVNLQDPEWHSHSKEGALEATFPFPKGLGHVWTGNGRLIRWLENLYRRSLQIHSSSPIERTTLQK